MTEDFEYRQSGRGPLVWISAAVVVFWLTYGIANDAPNVIVAVWCMAAAIIGWLLMLNPVRGIRIDQENLILNAWRKPKVIPLADIAFLRAKHWTDDSDVVIVYNDGTEESTHPRDMPDLNTLALVMSQRGVKVKDPGLMA